MIELIHANWSAPKKVKACTTTRPFDFGIRKGSDETKTLNNRQQLQSQLSLQQQPVWLKQVHGNDVATPNSSDTQPIADAAFTREKNIPCAVLTADCLPLVICDDQATEIAAIHAGWRGLLAGVIPETIKHFQSAPSNLYVWLGPAISQQYYEVGLDVVDPFLNQDQNYQKAFEFISESKALADIREIARLQLSKVGIDNISGGEYCTFRDAEKFFSCRRQKGIHGNMATLIWIED